MWILRNEAKIIAKSDAIRGVNRTLLSGDAELADERGPRTLAIDHVVNGEVRTTALVVVLGREFHVFSVVGDRAIIANAMATLRAALLAEGGIAA